MAASAHDKVQDEGLTYARDNATHLALCDGEPANLAAAQSGGANFIGEVAIGPGDFTLAAGDVSGRKATVAAQAGVSTTNSGSVDHVAIRNDTGAELLIVDPVSTPESVAAGGTTDVDAFSVEIRDP